MNEWIYEWTNIDHGWNVTNNL